MSRTGTGIGSIIGLLIDLTGQLMNQQIVNNLRTNY